MAPAIGNAILERVGSAENSMNPRHAARIRNSYIRYCPGPRATDTSGSLRGCQDLLPGGRYRVPQTIGLCVSRIIGEDCGGHGADYEYKRSVSQPLRANTKPAHPRARGKARGGCEERG